MDDKIKQNLSDAHTWLRLIYMVGFGVILYLSLMLFWLSPLVQFLFVLVSAKRSERVARWVDMLNQYIAQIMAFLSYDSEQKPFPFYDFPSSAIVVDTVGDSASSLAQSESDSHVSKQTEAVSEDSVVSEQHVEAQAIQADTVASPDNTSQDDMHDDAASTEKADIEKPEPAISEKESAETEQAEADESASDSDMKTDKGAIA